MQRATWGVVWLTLASMLAVGGCPSGGTNLDNDVPTVRAGVATGSYSGVMSCTIVGHSPDWTGVLEESFDESMSISMAEDGSLTVNGVPYFPGAMRAYMSNESRLVTDTIVDIVSHEDDTYARGPTQVMMAVPGVYTLTGLHVLSLESNDSGGVDVYYGITASSDDFSISQGCQGTLVP